MSTFELKLPQMGESVAEATLTSWLKEVGDTIEADEAVFEIATDKVDSEVPSEVDGVLLEKRFDIDDVVKVGEVVAVIQVGAEAGDSPAVAAPSVAAPAETQEVQSKGEATTAASVPQPAAAVSEAATQAEDAMQAAQQALAPVPGDGRFYSPLVRNMAREEGIAKEELEKIPGSGKDGRVTKEDMLKYIAGRSNTVQPATQEIKSAPAPAPTTQTQVASEIATAAPAAQEKATTAAVPPAGLKAGDEIIPLSRMGKLIAKHMLESVTTSAHVQSFVEVDVTEVVKWRERVKKGFEAREGEKLTFTPIFLEAVAHALKKYPLMNISLDGDRVIKKKNINLGMAAALPDGNLIVPVIRNADQLNLVGMARAVNDLAHRARTNALKPDEIQDGTYTVTNVGSFGSVFGTPIINQPQVGILALGAIRKEPSVIETADGDFIGIRSKMFLSHSYDHRVVNGALGGMFVKAVADYLEAWDPEREV
ncbi:2-oxoglutarate dehydrogenase E2 component (dihydrolipoamide succinyltransferase) [Robiginitalea myxolifaciens]|uniref:Dihydrolipoamide acetyltransferase component of pyruvate dehydrogenase complex n=1 Tax=Robiginitalea myxolifaciens TaxID=400055 RepID=A0A1I6FNL3_9FLAO|nr:dihydrolipoamide acetyltransferase family protein [Robiginitalea myxolifaciens]SFR31540.1 2-oxoglutarate dehydrogenase E2 component (dihydrolipoamide succinyltransferase) [Robiginitalea myxolifaciens]